MACLQILKELEEGRESSLALAMRPSFLTQSPTKPGQMWLGPLSLVKMKLLLGSRRECGYNHVNHVQFCCCLSNLAVQNTLDGAHMFTNPIPVITVMQFPIYSKNSSQAL